MAKATAICTCKECGKEFTKTATKRNRAEADSWEAWAVENYTLCGSCWYKQQAEEEKNAGLKAEVRFGNLYEENESVWFILYGDTYPIKDRLKESGAIWTENYPVREDSFAGGVFGGLLGKSPEKRWAIRATEDNAEKVAEKLVEIGFAISKYPSIAEIAGRKAIRAQLNKIREEKAAEEAEKEAEKNKKISEEIGEIPEWPQGFPPAPGRWNGRFYGRKGNRSIYIDNVKYDLPDDLAEAAEKAAIEREAWKEKKEKLEKDA